MTNKINIILLQLNLKKYKILIIINKKLSKFSKTKLLNEI